jgi:hypothetical protein
MDKTKRSLVKASLAAPLVLTVRTASATATSSAAACVDRDAVEATKSPTPDKMLDTTQDEWLRMDKDIVELCKYGSTTPLSHRRFYLGYDGSTYWELKQTTSGLLGEQTTYTTGTHKVNRKLSQGKFLIQHQDGKVISYGWEDKGGKNITCSCWTSLKMAGW